MTPIVALSQTTHLYSLNLRCSVVTEDGRRLFVKASESNSRDMKDFFRTEFARESTCLDVLRGLAIPNRVELPRAELARLTGTQPAYTILLEMVTGKSLERLRLSPEQKLAAWFFITEHLCAIRRHEILYTDVKCSNVVATLRPFRITLIDFNTCIPLESNGRYLANRIGRTPQFSAPEQSTLDKILTERAVVYQHGMLLAYLLCEISNGHFFVNRDRETKRLSKALSKFGSQPLVDLVLSCVESTVSKRPATYEHVLDAINALPNTRSIARAKAIWATLRAPHAARLAEVNL